MSFLDKCFNEKIAVNGRERNFILSMFALVGYHNQGIWNYWNVWFHKQLICVPCLSCSGTQNQVSFVVSNLLCCILCFFLYFLTG